MNQPSGQVRRDRDPPRRQSPTVGDRRGGPQPPRSLQAMPPRRTWLTFLIILVINYVVMRILFPGNEPISIPYTTFKEQVTKGNVESIYSKGAGIEGRFIAPVTWPPPEQQAKEASRKDTDGSLGGLFQPSAPRSATTFTTTLPAFVDPGLESFLIEKKVEISAIPIQSGSLWSTLLFGFGPAVLIIAFYVWMYRRAQPGRRRGWRTDGYRHEQGAPLRSGDGRTK